MNLLIMTGENTIAQCEQIDDTFIISAPLEKGIRSHIIEVCQYNDIHSINLCMFASSKSKGETLLKEYIKYLQTIVSLPITPVLLVR